MAKIRLIRPAFLLAALLATAMAAYGAEKADVAIESAMKNYRAGHYRKALAYFEKAEVAGPKEEKAKLVRYAVSTIKQFQAILYGIEKEEALFRRNPSDASLRSSLSQKHEAFARILMLKEFYLPMVEPHLKRVIRLDPANTRAYPELGDAYYAAMQYIKALQAYEKALSLMPENLYAYKMAGDVCVAIGDYDRAKKFYSDLVKMNEKALLKYKESETEKIKAVMKVLPQTYKDIDVLLKEGRVDEAEVVLKKRLSLNAADYIAMTELGNIYAERSERSTALRLFKNAVKIAPDYPISHLYLGRLHFLMRNYDDAISELNLFKEKIRLLPKMEKDVRRMYIASLYYLSEVYFTLKMYEESRKESEEILKLDPNEQGAHYNLGVYYYAYEHSRPKAYQAFKRSVEIDPTTRIAKEARYAIEFMRNNPDSRIVPDFSFIDQEYRS